MGRRLNFQGPTTQTAAGVLSEGVVCLDGAITAIDLPSNKMFLRKLYSVRSGAGTPTINLRSRAGTTAAANGQQFRVGAILAPAGGDETIDLSRDFDNHDDDGRTAIIYVEVGAGAGSYRLIFTGEYD